MPAPNQDRQSYGASIAQQGAINAAQQTTLRSNSIIQAARGSADMGIAAQNVIETIDIPPTIDPITGEPDAEPVRPPDYFRVGDRLGSAPLKP